MATLLAVHISDGVMRHSWELVGFLIMGAILARSAIGLQDRDLPRLAVVTSAFFVGTLIHIPFGPTAVHLLLNGVAGVILGRRAPLAIACGLFLQVLLLHHGGWLTLGLNGVVLSIPALIAGFLARLPIPRIRRWQRIWRIAIGTLAALMTVLLNALVLGLGGIADWSILIRLVVLAHIPLILVEGAIAGAIGREGRFASDDDRSTSSGT